MKVSSIGSFRLGSKESVESVLNTEPSISTKFATYLNE